MNPIDDARSFGLVVIGRQRELGIICSRVDRRLPNEQHICIRYWYVREKQ